MGSPACLEGDRLRRQLFADHHGENRRVQRALECAADEVSAGPRNLGMKRLQTGQLQPDVAARLNVKMCGGPKTVRRQIEDPNRHAAGTALTEARTHLHMSALSLAAIGARLNIKLARDLDWVAVVQHHILCVDEEILRSAQSPEKLMPTLAPHIRASLRS